MRSFLLVRKLDAEDRQDDQERNEGDGGRGDQPLVPRATKGIPADTSPEDDEARRCRRADDEHRCKQDRALKRQLRQPHGEHDDRRDGKRRREVARGHG